MYCESTLKLNNMKQPLTFCFLIRILKIISLKLYVMLLVLVNFRLCVCQKHRKKVLKN